jgi:hypothetical protein
VHNQSHTTAADDRQTERALPVRSQPASGTHAHTLCSHWHTLSQHQGPGYHATPRWSRRTDGWMRLLIDIENNNFAKTGSGQVKKKGAFVYINGLTMGHCASQSPLRRGIPSPFRGHQPAKNTLFVEFSLRSSRACLGKTIVFGILIEKAQRKGFFSHCARPELRQRTDRKRRPGIIRARPAMLLTPPCSE